MSGFYLMHRGWLDNPALGLDDEPFCRRAAWAWLIENAAFEPRQVRLAGKVVTLERGQLSHSLRFLAKSWGWGHERCRRFLSELRDNGMIETASATGNETGQTLITICNYTVYQSTEKPARQVARQLSRQQRDSNETIRKELKELKKDSPLTPQGRQAIEEAFAQFWGACPRKVGKDAAQRKYRLALKQADAETLLTAIRRYAQTVAGKERDFVAHPATWLHQGRWKDEDVAEGGGGNGVWRDPGPDEPPPLHELSRPPEGKFH